jgi:hypothetical protein
VDQENATALEPNNHIFAATLNGRDTLAFELGCDRCGILRASQAPVEDLDAVDPPADEHRLELGTNRLDLGQLRHAAQPIGGRTRATVRLYSGAAGPSSTPPRMCKWRSITR